MALNPQNPQRGTDVRRGTGVRPAPAPAPAPAAGANRPTSTRRPGAPAPAPGTGARPVLRSAPQNQGSGKVGKFLLLFIIFALIGMVAYGFIPRKGKDGATKPGLFMALLNKYLPMSASKGEADPALPDLDRRYNRAIESREKAKAYLNDQQKFAEAPDKLSEVERNRVVMELEKFRIEVESGTDDLARVAAAEGKETKFDAATAKEEQKKQKAFAMELGVALVKWRGPIGEIFKKADAPEFVANKFNSSKPEEKKPEEKRDPKRGETFVAPASPNDIPKPPTEPEKPKEDPKPEPKPEPEKPKPAEPKPEPEKPKPEPKPEPEKPKEEPKPEPKPEPEKPKEEPKPAKKVDVLVAEADQLVLEGRPLAVEVLGAAKNLPDNVEKLKTLTMKLETAQAFFVKARDTYASIKDDAPAAADVAAKLGKIEKILELLQKAGDGIKSKLK
jgi:hypothetical protein